MSDNLQKSGKTLKPFRAVKEILLLKEHVGQSVEMFSINSVAKGFNVSLLCVGCQQRSSICKLFVLVCTGLHLVFLFFYFLYI